ncbi:FkbM family methyltransferase [Roseiconus nitratireducens]|uniref:FkbM family methyltransferase n=1 Tax=Roseiconus nitratireducens TaxID=2605748 RepID=A0A5M6D6T3_9BACT|nr:FkbM family methyltransferase [Roseiconus nitratireducens]KAA5543063.1 FkbM family methyltransferase [Roseiconus nitratireducens]
MDIASFVYKRYLSSGQTTKRAWSFARKVLIKLFNDPACSLPIHDVQLKMPLSHLLPAYLRQFPNYDRLPQRISRYVHQKHGRLNCVDVGANIGDTLAAFYTNETDAFLAIEPNPKFQAFLTENWGWNQNVKIVSEICSDYSEEGTFAIHEKSGTASIRQSQEGATMRRRPLDAILSDHPFSGTVDVLKVDTDGHDFEVINGATELISKQHPMVLLECDSFGNTDYVDQCLQTLRLFEESGYRQFLLYDNFGQLMGKHQLSDLSSFRNLLFYQLTSSFFYFDILLIQDEDFAAFYQSEIDYFVAKMSDESLRPTASSAASLLHHG